MLVLDKTILVELLCILFTNFLDFCQIVCLFVINEKQISFEEDRTFTDISVL